MATAPRPRGPRPPLASVNFLSLVRSNRALQGLGKAHLVEVAFEVSASRSGRPAAWSIMACRSLSSPPARQGWTGPAPRHARQLAAGWLTSRARSRLFAAAPFQAPWRAAARAAMRPTSAGRLAPGAELARPNTPAARWPGGRAGEGRRQAHGRPPAGSPPERSGRRSARTALVAAAGGGRPAAPACRSAPAASSWSHSRSTSGRASASSSRMASRAARRGSGCPGPRPAAARRSAATCRAAAAAGPARPPAPPPAGRRRRRRSRGSAPAPAATARAI